MAEQERLTARDPAGNAYFPECFKEPCGGGGCTKDHCVFLDSVCDKLAGYEEQGDQTEKLLAESEAARAELGKRVAAAQKMNAELTDAQAVMVREFDKKLEELAKVKARMRWISVKDRLPEQEECVLLLCKTQYGTSYKCIGFYESGTMHRDDSDYCWDYEVCDIYDEENDDYLVNKGWFERVFNWDDYSACGIEDTVTHWMPLPEPPEKEENPHEKTDD